MADSKDDGKGSAGLRALFTGASATNGALFGSILGPLGALAGAVIMGGITLAITSLSDGTEVLRPERAASQEKETLTDNNDLSTFRDRVSCVLDEIGRPREDYWTWADTRNDAVGVLPVEVRLMGSAADVFLKWKFGYDERNSAGTVLDFLAAVGQGVIGHWGGAATSLVKAGINARRQERSYQAFLDSDKYLASCGTIMVAYDAEIFSTSLIILKRATATETSDGHGGSLHDFGGKIVDQRSNHR